MISLSFWNSYSDRLSLRKCVLQFWRCDSRLSEHDIFFDHFILCNFDLVIHRTSLRENQYYFFSQWALIILTYLFYSLLFIAVLLLWRLTISNLTMAEEHECTIKLLRKILNILEVRNRSVPHLLPVMVRPLILVKMVNRYGTVGFGLFWIMHPTT